MAEAKSVQTGDRPRSSGRQLVERLSEARWLIASLVATISVLFLFGFIGAPGSVLLVIAIVLLIGVVPVPTPNLRANVVSPPQPAIWPETSIKLFAEALPDPCFVLDQRGIVRYANTHASSTFPIKPGDPLTFRLRIPELTAAFDRVAKGGQPERVEFSERVPTERWFAAWFARLSSPSIGNFIVVILGDLSEQRRIDRIRVDFVANASHELRTPLASLAGFVETLQGSARDDPAARERFLAIMHDQANRMSRLIDDLLSLSRIELKVHVRPPDQVDLVPIISHVVDSLEPQARDLGVVIEADFPTRSAVVTGDRDELIQVFENLVENAIKYGQAGKRVVVAIKPATAAGGPTASVRDFGPGIAEEHLPRLTERFYRINVEESRQHRGTGLGLAIVKHILARHGARMTIKSRPGEGALFSVNFPQVEIKLLPNRIEYYQ
jgi:two-component system, OmpR family, phosphate regulon sensor histidine kinase PhoR